MAPCFVAMHLCWAGQPQQLGWLQSQICCPPSCQLRPAASYWLSRCLPSLLSSHPALPYQVEESDSRKHLNGSAVDSANVDLEAGMATIQAHAEDSIKAGAGKKGLGREAEARSRPWSPRPESQVGLPAFECLQQTPCDAAWLSHPLKSICRCLPESRQHVVLPVRKGVTPSSSQVYLTADVCPAGQQHGMASCRVRNCP